MMLTGTINGSPATLDTTVKDGVVEGVIDEGGYRYLLAGQEIAGEIDGVLSDLVTGGQLPLTARMDETTFVIVSPVQARFDSVAATPSEPADSQSGPAVDERLVGTWLFSESMGGFGVLQDRLSLHPDGTYTVATKMSGDVEEQVSHGRWRGDGQVLHNDDGFGFQPFARYQVDGPTMLMEYLASNGERRIWKRAGYA